MPENVDTGLLPRTYFKAPRVPFDFRALTLAVAGYLVYWSGGLLLSEIFGRADVPGSFLAAAYDIFRDLPYVGGVIGTFLSQVFHTDVRAFPSAEYTFWHVLVGGTWFVLVWSFFGQAIHRITALRIARDEGLSFGEAFRFSARNWVTVLIAPVIILAAIAFFYGCNAFAGLAISIPFVGQILGLLLLPLATLSSLLILLIAVGGIFGLPLVGAAAAWERNGSLDAISRAFSYIFARPLQFFWNYFLIFLFLGIVLIVGSWFVFTLTKSVDAGVLSDRLSVQIDPPERGSEDFKELAPEAQNDYDTMADPGKTGYRGGRADDSSPFVKHFDAVIAAPWSHKLNALVFWITINLIWLGVFGYAIYWFLGASTSVYADLRADVDGTEEDEIFLEEEEEDFDALADASVSGQGGEAQPEPPAEPPAAPAPAPEAPPAPDAPNAPDAPDAPPPESTP